ncbi:hypothetical protein [Lysobacter gummosus]|uniref:hypothetical protein n=1 Tax=Lysobacter gummosus TaxID=262324 RepID=UPI003642CF84
MPMLGASCAGKVGSKRKADGSGSGRIGSRPSPHPSPVNGRGAIGRFIACTAQPPIKNISTCRFERGASIARSSL